MAGAMNAIAGGGSFITFPALVFTGVPSIVANASSTVALFPASLTAAWGYRKHLRDVGGISIRTMLIASTVGGMAGAFLLLYTKQRVFDVIVPWLLLMASVTFTFGPKLAPYLRRLGRIHAPALFVVQFILAVYGGYFGAAVGIMTLAAWSLLGQDDLHAMNAAKNVLVGSMNLVATVCFIVADKVSWPEALTMLVGGVLGGYFAARMAGRMSPKGIRVFIIVASFVVTAVFFYKAYLKAYLPAS
jgi:uncharacterized membrane protein YfcA